jgi:gamma-glutamylcyclotransferase (GGCT)/AIG2-like uncharacterized protein YtfP
MSSDGPAHLFVYGTLMTRSRARLGADMRARLRLEGTSLGAATTAGRLVDLGTYPGLVPAESARDVVHGELFRLERPGDVLAVLDAYEEVSSVPAPGGEYTRILAPARLASGEKIMAWVYCFRGDFSPARLIAGGRWDC